MANPYATVLAVPGARSFVVAGIVGRLPISMLGLGTVVLVERRYGSYALAGAASAVLAASQAGSGPPVSRLLDRLGQARVLLPTLAVHVVGLVGLLGAAQVRAPRWALLLAAAVAGASSPQISACVRARWSALLGGRPELKTAFALESVADEVVFVVGPVLVTTLAAATSPLAGLGCALVFVSAGTLAFAAQRSTEPPPSGAGGRAGPPAIARPGLRVLVAAFLALGAVFGALEVSMVAFAEEQGADGAAGVMLALVAAGSLVAGLAYGARPWSAAPGHRLRLGVVGLAFGVVPLALAGTLASMALAAVVAGFAVSPTLIASYEVVERLVPASALTEGFAWISTSLVVGIAAGASLSGWVVEAAGAGAGFVACAAAGLVSAVVVSLGARWLLRAPEPLAAGRP